MTAIVAVYTPEGYILAADGRQMHGASFDDETIKLFHSSTPHLEVAWGCFGAVGIPFSAIDSFDLAETSIAVSKQMVCRDFSSLEEYAMEMANAVYATLSFYCLKHSAILCCTEEIFPGLVFVGYLDGKPERVKVEIRHSGCHWLNPSLADFSAHPCGLAIGHGPEMVLHGMENSEMLYTPKSLDEGKKLAESYIEICIANNQKFDECKGIGGDIHIAAVTPNGFEWKIKPQGAMD